MVMELVLAKQIVSCTYDENISFYIGADEYINVYLSCLSTVSAITAMRLGRYTKGTSRTTSLPCSQKLKAPRSATKFSPTISFAIFLCWRSLAMEMLKDLNHLQIQIW